MVDIAWVVFLSVTTLWDSNDTNVIIDNIMFVRPLNPRTSYPLQLYADDNCLKKKTV